MPGRGAVVAGILLEEADEAVCEPGPSGSSLVRCGGNFAERVAHAGASDTTRLLPSFSSVNPTRRGLHDRLRFKQLFSGTVEVGDWKPLLFSCTFSLVDNPVTARTFPTALGKEELSAGLLRVCERSSL